MPVKIEVCFKQYDRLVHSLIRDGNTIETAIETADTIFSVKDTYF